MASTPTAAAPSARTPAPHTLFDDAQALVAGTMLASLGVALMTKAGLVTGGIAGLCLLLHHATGAPFGAIFLVLSLPFYLFAIRRLGWTFTLKTLGAVLLFSSAAELLPRALDLARIQPWYAACMGGILVGTGLLVLFRHQASLGGFNVLCLWLQERRGWPAGLVQLAIDTLILLASLTVIAPRPWLYSLLGTAILNLTLAVNHRPCRYAAR
ncbi:YitT family protein [Massilia aerilata]|uniref:YitT family protein n=1 Tax=Massilia aerilata TaxID=453817 RepID=A0ABW0S112_9BURK